MKMLNILTTIEVISVGILCVDAYKLSKESARLRKENHDLREYVKERAIWSDITRCTRKTLDILHEAEVEELKKEIEILKNEKEVTEES